MMTCNEMVPAVGTVVMVSFESVNVACSVVDVKESWGRPRLLVAPMKGNGQQWVEMGRISRGECRAANIGNDVRLAMSRE